MRKWIACLFCFFLLAGAALADPVSFGNASFDSEAEYIDLGEQQVGERQWSQFVDFLKQFPNLKKVDMFATQVSEAQVNKLVGALPDVEFGWTLQLMKYKNKHIVRTDARYFSTNHGVCPNHNDRDFTLIGYCRDLLALDLGHNYITDLSFLRNMPHLRVLILGENQKLKNLEPIGELQDLEYLELFTCAFRDITPLTKLPRLMDLNLCNNAVTDWRPLKEMKQLKRLWVSGLKIRTSGSNSRKMTREERDELQAALPDTEIMFTGDPVANGWRYYNDYTKGKDPDNLVPHFAVIDAMRVTNTYIPFEESAPLPGEESAGNMLLVTDEIDPSMLTDEN